MKIHAYSEDYLNEVQCLLGDMLDFAVVTCGYDIEKFLQMFVVSGYAHQVEIGNPAYVSGRSGGELARLVIKKSGLCDPLVPDQMYLDKSPEYWCGHTLAFYQWYTLRPFGAILDAMPATELLNRYTTLHEADIMRSVDVINGFWNDYYTQTNLRRIRSSLGMTQKALAEKSLVPLRQIQLFEQRERDINKAQLGTVCNLCLGNLCAKTKTQKQKNMILYL